MRLEWLASSIARFPLFSYGSVDRSFSAARHAKRFATGYDFATLSHTCTFHACSWIVVTLRSMKELFITLLQLPTVVEVVHST